MTALSIRHMRFTMREQEQQRDAKDAEMYAILSEEEKAEQLHYWHVEKRTRRGWKYVTQLFMTKRDVAKYWIKFFRGKKEFRLHHRLAYGEVSK